MKTILFTLSSLMLLGFTQLSLAEDSESFEPPRKPPLEAIDACADKAVDDPCEFEGRHRTVSGTCALTPDQSYFSCRPDNKPHKGYMKHDPKSEGMDNE